MLLIFGTRIYETVINYITFVCGYCRVAAPQNVIERRNRFTLFFLPLFTVSIKYVNECTNCEASTPLTSDQAQHSVAWANSHR